MHKECVMVPSTLIHALTPATSHDSVLDILVSKKSNAMLVFILFSTEENLVSFLCRFARRLPPHFTESEDFLSVPVHFVC